MGEAREEPRDHTLGDFEPYNIFAAEESAFSGMPQPNAGGAPQHRPLQPLHFSMERLPLAMEEREKLDLIEERLRVIEGIGDYLFVDMAELCLVSDVVVPPKFKVSNFDKYKGTTCPKNHLKMYCRKMGAYSRDEKLLMHFFQESLAGAMVTWYTNLEVSRIRSWKDLMDAFIRQYQYNTNMSPNRTQLQNMSKKEHESFKEYAQRRRDLAAQVAPPMMEREMITMIMDTLLVFYYEKMVDYMPSSFADLVFAGEKIKVGLRRGKFNYATSTSTSNRRFETSGAKKKEGDTHAVTSAPTWLKSQQTPHNPTYQYSPHQRSYSANIENPPNSTPVQQRLPAHPQRPPPQNSFPTQSRPTGNPNPSTSTNSGRNFPAKKLVEFTLIPTLYVDLLPSLITNQMVVVNPGKIYQFAFPR